MCSSKAKVTIGVEITATATSHVSRINGRPVLQPTCNRVPNLEKRNSIKKVQPKSLSPPSSPFPSKINSLTPPISPKLKSPRPQATKRGNESNNVLNTSCEKIVVTPTTRKSCSSLERKKSKSFKEGSTTCEASSLSYCSSLITESPGSIAAVRREQMALQNAQRKMKIAHYGRSKSAKFETVVPIDTSNNLSSKTTEEEKRCSFITPNSGNSKSTNFNTN